MYVCVCVCVYCTPVCAAIDACVQYMDQLHRQKMVMCVRVCVVCVLYVCVFCADCFSGGAWRSVLCACRALYGSYTGQKMLCVCVCVCAV